MLYLIAPVAGFLLLAAHFYRSENLLLALVFLLAIFLVSVRRPWAAYAMQICLLLGAVEWLRSTISLVLARSAAGAPFLRLAIILGSVTLFTALAALVFRTRRLRKHFGFGSALQGDAS
jgi:hypothetical protein